MATEKHRAFTVILTPAIWEYLQKNPRVVECHGEYPIAVLYDPELPISVALALEAKKLGMPELAQPPFEAEA